MGNDIRIRRTSHALADDRRNVVTRCLELGDAPMPQILIELELHADRVSGMSTNRSRAISAPYAMHASTSGSWMPYSSMTSCMVQPEARKSSTSETQIRCPL